MKRVGEIVGATQGVAVVRAPGDEHPGIGTTVIDEQLEDVGRVVDVFGPVDRPYLAVTPARKSVVPLVGNVLYSRE